MATPLCGWLPAARCLEFPCWCEARLANIDIAGGYMAVIFKVDDSKLLKKMKQYEAVCKKEVSQQIRNHGRLLGLELMRQAQPFYEAGGQKAAKEQGEGAISSDLNAIFIVLNAYWTERFKESKSINKGLYNKQGEEWLSDKYELAGTLREILDWHRKQKAGKRRPSKRGDKTMGRHKSQEYMVAPESLIKRAYKQIIKAVGWSKAGWAKAAQECKADTKAAAKLSGIPLWIKRHVGAARGNVVDMTNGWWNTSGNPKVILRSGVNWQSKIITEKQRRDSSNLTRGKFIRFLSTAIRAELKKQNS
jgi:hypothetical protein